MADPALKIVPENAEKATAAGGRLTRLGRRVRMRFVLLVAIPALAAVLALTVYLMGGRYISTDNAYIGAQKVLITPDISGKIGSIVVREGQHVAAGDVLFTIDPQPFRYALSQAEAKLAGVRTEFDNLKSNLQTNARLVDLAEKTVDLKQKDLDRKNTLINNRSGSQADVDNAMAALVTAQNQLVQLKQQQAAYLNQLKGDPDLPIAQYWSYIQAKAVQEQAQRDLDHTTLRAPIAGTATQVDSIQLGRYVTAGTPVLSVIDDSRPWVDANPKETDVTYLRIGQKVTIDVDAFPNQTFHGTVTSVSPGTGAQFAVLPAQNASGNWVKVVQRVPVRITFDPNQHLDLLRAGMSVTVEIDTKRNRSLFALLGLTSAAKEPAP
jgi:membrane fusion protein (multidrug efflux system)